MDSELIVSFCSITGADSDVAVHMLEASGGDIEAAVNIFFTSGGHGHLQGDVQGDEELARRLTQDQAMSSEDTVRAPLPVVTQRLVGDYHAVAAPPRSRPTGGTSFTRAFKDGNEDLDGAGSSGLAASFEPPRELLSYVDLDEARQAALESHQWLLLNVQSSDEFASHRLNRDTWRDPIISDLVRQNFVFYQVYTGDEEGLQVMSGYRVTSIPAILVIDPETGAPMRTWTGFMSPDRLAEELLPFMEMPFDDPKASMLATRKQRPGSASGAAQPQNTETTAMDDDEDTDLLAAIQASLEAASQASAPSPLADLPDRSSTATTTSTSSSVERAPKELAAEARSRLPPEPEGNEGCRIAIRLPDGSRIQRRFQRSAPLAAVHDLCLASDLEAAAGRPFTLVPSYPGASALAFADDTTLEGCGMADSMVVMRWTD